MYKFNDKYGAGSPKVHGGYEKRIKMEVNIEILYQEYLKESNKYKK